jgi:hypothetical protein
VTRSPKNGSILFQFTRQLLTLEVDKNMGAGITDYIIIVFIIYPLGS